jgi:hypothetical protein
MSTARAPRALAAEIPHRTAPSPEEILAALEVQPRTQNILRRYLADAPATDGGWTFERLLQIPGFGRRALDDVIGALDSQRGNGVVTGRRRHRLLETEVAEILSTRQRRAEWPPTPLLDRALDLIAGELPASEADLSKRIVAAGLARVPLDLARIERAARFRDTPPPFAVLRREGFVIAVPGGKLALAATIHGLAVRAVVNWGMAQVGRIGFLSNADDPAFVTSVLSAKDSFRWLDEALGWFWFESERSPLVRAIAKVLQVAPAVDLDDLTAALFRRWAPENVPSRKALQALCGQVSLFRMRRSTVSLANPAESALTPADRSVVTLFQEFGPQIEGHRLPEIAASLNVPCAQLGRHLRGSPFVLEPSPGVFRLVGSPVNGT